MTTTTRSPVGKQVLDETPGRALTFLRAIGTSREIRAAMIGAGYSDADHAEGWRLMHQVSGFDATPALPKEDKTVREAILALDAWDEDGLRRIGAALRRLHPAQAEFVLNGLEAQEGAASVLVVQTLLERLNALESSPERKATREADAAALDTLSKRGITKEERARLGELVKVAQSPSFEAPPEAPKSDDGALLAMRAWFEDWSETARSVIRRRDHLIRLGLAQRRKPAATDDTPPAP